MSLCSKPESVLRQAIVDEALTWVKTPWRHQGEIKGAGVDCGKLIYKVYKHLERVPEFDVPCYSRQWMLHRDYDEMLSWSGRLGFVATDTPLPGDVAIWKIGRTYSHAAIIIDWPRFVHADATAGFVFPCNLQDCWFSDKPVLFFTHFKGL